MAVSIALAAVGAGLAIYGAVKKGQAEKRAKQNLANRPKYAPIDEDQSELNLATSQANQGMGASARQQLQNNTDRTLSTSANAILMGGGDANAIGNLAERSQNAYNQNAIYDDQVRQQHLGNLMKTYSLYNAQRRGDADKQFQVNQYGPWADRQQLYGQQVAGGQQTMNSGINMFTSAASGINFKGKEGGAPDTGYGMGSDMQSGHAPMDVSWRGDSGPATGMTGGSFGSYGQGAATNGDGGGWQGYINPNELKRSPTLVPYYENQ